MFALLHRYLTIAGSLLAIVLIGSGWTCSVGGERASPQDATSLASRAKQSKTAKPSSDVGMIARGKYIVEGVAACGHCHTPRDENGEPDRARWLAGAPLFLQPVRPVPGWPVTAPRLAGLPPGSDADIITLLTTGVWKDGKPLRLPMPRFRMTRSDAEAVVAYLRSL
jgi:mono/diheme cytochrome c family protein